MDAGWSPGFPGCRSAMGVGGGLCCPGWWGCRLGQPQAPRTLGFQPGILAGAPLSLMLTPGEQDGGRAWVPGAADMAPELSCWARPSASSSDKRGSKDLLQKHRVSVVAGNTSRLRKVRWPGAPASGLCPPPTPLLPGPILQGAGHPKLPPVSSFQRGGAGRLAWGGRTTGPRQERGRAGRSSGNVGPKVRCLGGLPAAAANVSTLGGRATHGGKEGDRAEWGKGEPSHCTAPHPRGGGRRDRGSQSLCCLLTSLGSRAVTLSPVF